MTFKKRALQIWRVVGAIWIVGFFVFIVYDYAVNGPKAELVLSKLEDEFRSVAPLPDARSCDYFATHKTQHALVTSKYRTSLPYVSIRAHYDAELTRHGWVFYEEKETRDWGMDLGGKTARYCKGEYRASLEYAGEQADNGWDYAFSVSWGLGSLTDKYSDKFSKVGCK